MKILSFGEIIWDIYNDKKLLGGAPLNFAAHAVKQNADAWLISSVGNDTLGETAINNIKKLNVNTDYISVNENPTGQCLVTLNDKKVPHYNLLENASYDFIEFPNLTQKFDAISFGTLSLRSENNISVLKKIIENYKFEIIFSDLNIRPPFYSNESIIFCLSNSNIVKISDEELPVIIKSVFNIENLDIKNSIIKLCEKFENINHIIITKGSEGAITFDSKIKEFYSCPAKKVNVVSTVGAGDSFGAAFLVEYFKTNDVNSALHKATCVSAYVVSKLEAIPD